MIEYFFKMVICSSLFLGFYFLFLQKEKIFRFNRAYLLITLSLSLSIPLFFITLPATENKIEHSQTIPSGKKQLAATNIIEKNEENTTEEFADKNTGIKNPKPAVLIEETIEHAPAEWVTYFKWENILLFFYINISSLLIIKFLINFFIIYRKIFKSKKIKYRGVFLIINEDKEPLYSFWKYIFIPKQNLNENFSRKELLDHEIAHIKQKHSLDILFIELIKSIFWINPAFYLYKKAIQLNHEFLADEVVLKTKTDIYEYQKLILNSIQTKQVIPITSNFNYILTKKRLLMMTKKGNSTKALLLQLFCLPFSIILIYIFSNKIYAQENIMNELTIKQKDQLKQALQIEDISRYLKDTLVNASQNYIDTLRLGNKTYVVSSSKEALEKIFKNGNNPKVSELPKEEYARILKSSTPEEIGKAFTIRELTETDKKKILAKSAKAKDDSIYFYKVSPIHSKGDNSTDKYYNSPEWKKKVEDMEKKGKEISAYYNSPEWKKKVEDMEKKGKEISAYYNSPEGKKKVEEMEKQNKNPSVHNDVQGSNDMDEFKEEMRKFRQEMRGIGRQIRNLSKN